MALSLGKAALSLAAGAAKGYNEDVAARRKAELDRMNRIQELVAGSKLRLVETQFSNDLQKQQEEYKLTQAIRANGGPDSFRAKAWYAKNKLGWSAQNVRYAAEKGIDLPAIPMPANGGRDPYEYASSLMDNAFSKNKDNKRLQKGMNRLYDSQYSNGNDPRDFNFDSETLDMMNNQGEWSRDSWMQALAKKGELGTETAPGSSVGATIPTTSGTEVAPGTGGDQIGSPAPTPALPSTEAAQPTTGTPPTTSDINGTQAYLALNPPVSGSGTGKELQDYRDLQDQLAANPSDKQLQESVQLFHDKLVKEGTITGRTPQDVAMKTRDNRNISDLNSQSGMLDTALSGLNRYEKLSSQQAGGTAGFITGFTDFIRTQVRGVTDMIGATTSLSISDRRAALEKAGLNYQQLQKAAPAVFKGELDAERVNMLYTTASIFRELGRRDISNQDVARAEQLFSQISEGGNARLGALNVIRSQIGRRKREVSLQLFEAPGATQQETLRAGLDWLNSDRYVGGKFVHPVEGKDFVVANGQILLRTPDGGHMNLQDYLLKHPEMRSQ